MFGAHDSELSSNAGSSPLFESERRVAVLEAVRARPGASPRELHQATGIPAGTLRFHLAVLVRDGHVELHHHGHRLLYFLPHAYRDHEEHQLAVLRDPFARRLHEWVTKHPLCRKVEAVAAALAWGDHESGAYERLTRLLEAGLLRRTADNRLARLVAAPIPANVLANSPDFASQVRGLSEPA